LGGQRPVLGRGHRVVADLADGDHAVLLEVPGHQVEHAEAPRIVGLLGIQRDRRVVPDAELRRPVGLPADQRVEVVDERPRVGARLAEPERRFHHGPDPGVGHPPVVVGGAGGHVDVGIEDTHLTLLG
jgi:hypothetical protein